jgi:hypothetical protein
MTGRATTVAADLEAPERNAGTRRARICARQAARKAYPRPGSGALSFVTSGAS